jgi:DNA-binding LacI/PurR family transcriptional regulator
MAGKTGALRVTSLDVARLAGVSRSTVSQILNGNEKKFPQGTRDRVGAAARELSYRPSRAGRSLVTGLSDLIVVVVPNVIFGRNLQDAVASLSVRAARSSMSVVLRLADADPLATVAAILDLRPAYVIDLGVFDMPSRHAIEGAGIRMFPTREATAHFAEDPNHYVGRLQARHLLESGNRRLVTALLLDDRVDVLGPARQQGVADESATLGAQAPLVIKVPLTLTGAVDALSSVTEQVRDRAIGVCCYNDDVAIAVVAAARELDMSIPSDIAVIGVDHTQIGQLLEPRLTTVDVDFTRILEALGDTFGDPGGPDKWPSNDDVTRLVTGGTT